MFHIIFYSCYFQGFFFTWLWTVSALTTIIKCEKIISRLVLHEKLRCRIPRKVTDIFICKAYCNLVAIRNRKTRLIEFKKKKTTRKKMLKHSKIGLAKLNVWQEEEFCVKLVAPLQHNQMMRPRFGYCFSFNQSWGGNFKNILSFLERSRIIIFY